MAKPLFASLLIFLVSVDGGEITGSVGMEGFEAPHRYCQLSFHKGHSNVYLPHSCLFLTFGGWGMGGALGLILQTHKKM